MNEQHGRRRTGARWPPEKRFEAQVAARDYNGLGSEGWRRLANREGWQQQCAREDEPHSHRAELYQTDVQRPRDFALPREPGIG
ncbi:hypothetical protein SBA1_550035 [Candidatus Sulfotelmatobacter kueseliae]|uniref:Uncharacterized protein n=1 Tax=Candidatus Sulfotelmatobacter kueseliae TaxID=2042962 RepID=A0A2U3KYJ5_9BACT|nr:hypothetical protein SBA1_550035 [Candidatus Sulfotelmatobacter kueseliae]